jgi:long-chain acyl-CoA synthetase
MRCLVADDRARGRRRRAVRGSASSSPRAPAPDPPRPRGIGPTDLQAIVYTSGTTGRPKGVMLTAAALRAVAEAGVGMLGLRAADRVGIVTPLFHLYALREVDAACARGPAWWWPATSPSPPRSCGSCTRSASATSPASRGLRAVRGAVRRDAGALPRATCARCAGDRALPARAPLRPPLRSARDPADPHLWAHGGQPRLHRDAEDPDSRPGSIGRPYPGVELRALDDRGRPLAPNSRAGSRCAPPWPRPAIGTAPRPRESWRRAAVGS